jgi:hypothetical protein
MDININVVLYSIHILNYRGATTMVQDKYIHSWPVAAVHEEAV